MNAKIDSTISKYDKVDENKYYSPTIVLTLLEEYINKDIDSKMEEVKKYNITVNSTEIKKYLELESDTNYVANGWYEDFINHYFDNYINYTLEYYEKSIDIFKIRTLKLLETVKTISNSDNNQVTTDLDNLNINLNNGKISQDDIHKLLNSTINSINKLEELIYFVNNLDTYKKIKFLLNSNLSNNEIGNDIEKKDKKFLVNQKTNMR